MTTSPHGSNNFDAIRLLAAVAVIFDHAYFITKAPTHLELMGNSVGAIAVKIFFVISGYLVYTSWSRDANLFRYLARRALRIFPGLIVVCLVAAFVVGPIFTSDSLGTYFRSTDTYKYFSNVYLYQNYFLPGVFTNNAYPRAVNGSIWSLPVEFSMYLILPIIAFTSKRKVVSWVLPLATVALCFLSLWRVRIRPPQHTLIYYATMMSATLDVTPYFLIGALIRHVRLERWLDPTFALFLVVLAALLQPSGPVLSEVILYFLLPYVTLSLALATHKWFACAGRFGDFSYGVYIYAFMIQQCVSALFGPHMPAIANALLALPITLVVSVVSWHLVEKPSLSFKPKAPRRADTPALSGPPVGVQT